MPSFNSDRYDDLISRHRQASDLLWSLKAWPKTKFDNTEQSVQSKQLVNKNTQISSIITPVHYGTLPRTSEQIKSDISHSLALKHTIETLNNDSDTHERAKSIINEMSHRLDIRSARVLAFIFAKIFNQVYENIYIDRVGMDLMRQLYGFKVLDSSPKVPQSPMTISSTLFAILNTFSRTSPINSDSSPSPPSLPSPLTSKHYITSPRIVYLPTHRSYMDFIILTYLCFEYNIPLPCIAAAQDFLGLGLLANLLRNCGAFFIRRSFRSDFLYWTIFDEYVKTHLIHGDYPLEFFIEGARSRTLKTLLPVRQGMLKSCLECYFRRDIDNLILVPISINYERVLEDNLHANELLGIPKPKESKRSLFKSLQIVKRTFGTMIVKFCQPIQVHDAYELFRKQEETKLNNCSDAFKRSAPRGIQPRSICQYDGFTQSEEKFLDELSYRIVGQQQGCTVIYPITIAAFSFLNSSITAFKTRSISLEQISVNKNTLIADNASVLEDGSTNYDIFWPTGDDKSNIKQRLLSHFPDIFEPDGINRLKLKITGDHLVDIAMVMKLIMYRNTCLHLLAKPAYILLACCAHTQFPVSYQQLKMYYHFFVHLFKYEFVYDKLPAEDMNDPYFDGYLSYWIKKNYLIWDDATYQVNDNYREQISLIISSFEQYAHAYLLIYEQESIKENNKSVLTKIYQKNLLNKIDIRNISSVLASSSNVINNALRMLNLNSPSAMVHDLRHMLTRISPPTSFYLRAKL